VVAYTAFEIGIQESGALWDFRLASNLMLPQFINQAGP